MCINCIRSRIDITEGIPKQMTVQFCRACERYLSPPSAWVKADLESRELLALCLKRLKGLAKVRLVDAGFIWTEPHSKRLKVKLTIQQEVFSGAVLQQVFVVEFVVANQMCDACHRREAKDTWNAVAQVRQKVRHKKTFLHLEQLILKHHQHTNTVGIKALADGIDFFFNSRADAKHFTDFLTAVCPMRMKTSERLISHDVHSNTFNFKYTFAVEIVPVCRDDLVCLPPAVARSHGCMGQLAVCTGVGSSLHFIDFNTLQVAEIPASSYYADPFNAIASAAQLIELTIIDVEPVRDDGGKPVANRKYALVDVTVARAQDLGVNDTQFTLRSHLGHVLQPGDNVLGYDITCSNWNDEYANALDRSQLPDIVIVKKSYRDKRKKHGRRRWKLQQLTKEEEPTSRREEEAAQRDYEAFLQDLEEDKEMRGTVNIFKDPSYHSKGEETEEEDPELAVGVDEMLDEFAAMDMADGEQSTE